jgi:hypothetical protein
MADKDITDHTRKRLWWHADEMCAFPGCEQALMHETPDGSDDTIVGKECHIVAKKTPRSVARAPCLLTAQEIALYAHLIEHRNSFENLVLMCGVHSDIIDHVAQGYTVAQVLEIKRAHEQAVANERAERRAIRARAAEVPEEQSPSLAPRLLVLENIPVWERRAIKQLAEREPSTWGWLSTRVGEPAEGDRVVALVEEWPEQLATGSVDLCFALARQAERCARWKTAADVWQRFADRFSGATRADYLVRAAIDARMANNDDRYTSLLVTADQADPDSPRLRLERVNDERSPSEQLELLGGIHTDEEPLASLIAVQRARAALLLPDLDLAERHLAEAERLDPDSVAVWGMRINLEVQRARIALYEDRAFALTEARGAADKALSLREAMIEMGRWEESARLLMLAADVPALERDARGAQTVLERARPEEFQSPEGAEVLGDAALRAGAETLALRFTEDVEPTEAVRRIRAAAKVDRGGFRADGLRELRELALAGGPERERAAFARLGACMPPVNAPWDEEVASALKGARAERAVTSLRILTLAREGHLGDADDLADRLPNASWASEVRLRLAGILGNRPRLAQAARDFLAFGPDASGRLLAARALARAGELEHAGDTLVAVTHDINAPPKVRSDAFAILLRTLADRDEWMQAGTAWREWQAFGRQELAEVDDRIGAWQVRIAHHGVMSG